MLDSLTQLARGRVDGQEPGTWDPSLDVPPSSQPDEDEIVGRNPRDRAAAARYT
jgi:hypothetical protein